MMKQNSLKKWLSVIGCMVLIAALALATTGCGSKEIPTETTEPVTAAPTETTLPQITEEEETVEDVQVLGEGVTAFPFSVVDLEGNETKFEIHTDETTVGAALISLGLIEGEEGPYGLYVKKVNGIEAVYEEDGTYWAFYENGEYGLTGVDLTEIKADTAYSFVKTKG